MSASLTEKTHIHLPALLLLFQSYLSVSFTFRVWRICRFHRSHKRNKHMKHKAGTHACMCGLLFAIWPCAPRGCRQIQYQASMPASMSRARPRWPADNHTQACCYLHPLCLQGPTSLPPSVCCLFIFLSFLFFFLLILSIVLMFHPDLSPPPLAPFDHRIVTPKPHQIASYYTINRDEVLGG